MSRSRWKGPVTKKEIREKLSIVQESLKKTQTPKILVLPQWPEM